MSAELPAPVAEADSFAEHLDAYSELLADADPDDTDAVMLIITGDGASDTFPAVHDDVDPRTASLWLLAAHIHHVASAARASGDGTATMQDVAHDAIQLLSDHHDAPVETFSTGGGGQ